MTKRQALLLAHIIDNYIEIAQPISSKLLYDSGLFDLSSATLRAEMNQLEQLGYLLHLHTSGGRVPTDRAYRYFVNNLLNPESIKIELRARKLLDSQLQRTDDLDYINRSLAQSLAQLSESLVIASVDQKQSLYKTGLSSLFDYPEFQEFNQIFRLAEFFDHFEEKFAQMENKIKADQQEIEIFIGRESPISGINKETLMIAKYNLPYGYTGSLVLVGPIRMDYAKNISLIRYAQEKLNTIANYYE